MKYLLSIALFLISSSAYTQELHPQLGALENLLGGTWIADGQWGDGSAFKQESAFVIGLSGNMIKSKTWGNISQTEYKHGLRSEGVRFWDASDSTLKFWEFDVFGSGLEGEITIIDKNIYLNYNYDFGSGPMQLTDGWIFISENEYEFVVGVFENGEWKQKYISTPIKRIID
ncbi:MAG: hypothetical protein JJ971_03670 [Balneolaceae bacterium]|nr:hypothetical protein [Balneolaceae bacterium]MBO6545471.1 hypothetical protein [Balneolaceae bacterium]MBO6646867.1 hypothetical protein [Balneolaceae bacterium]